MKQSNRDMVAKAVETYFQQIRLEKNNFYITKVEQQLTRLLTVNTFNNSIKVRRIQDALERLKPLKELQDITCDPELIDALASHRIGFFGKAKAYINVEEAMVNFTPVVN